MNKETLTKTQDSVEETKAVTNENLGITRETNQMAMRTLDSVEETKAVTNENLGITKETKQAVNNMQQKLDELINKSNNDFFEKAKNGEKSLNDMVNFMYENCINDTCREIFNPKYAVPEENTSNEEKAANSDVNREGKDDYITYIVIGSTIGGLCLIMIMLYLLTPRRKEKKEE